MRADPDEQLLEITNEFATVRVRKVRTRNGERLEIASPRLGYWIRLDALALESLTWQPMDTFTRFLETPFGPTPFGPAAPPPDDGRPVPGR